LKAIGLEVEKESANKTRAEAAGGSKKSPTEACRAFF
jgi:hypothetical protein